MFDKVGFVEAMHNCLPAAEDPGRYAVLFDKLGHLAASADSRPDAEFRATFAMLAGPVMEQAIQNPHVRASVWAAAQAGAPNFRLPNPE